MELFGKKLRVPDMLEDGFRRGGDKTFAIYQHADGTRQSVTYRALHDEGVALLARLREAGLRPGDRVAVISALRPWWYSLYYALTLGGFRMVCIDPGVPQMQIHSMLRETQSRAVFTTSAAFRLPRLLEGRIPVYAVEAGFPLRSACEKVDLLLEAARPLPEDVFFILFSSGTTGERRKGVMLRHATIADAIEWNMATDSGIYRSQPAYSVRRRDLMLFPPYHVAGLLCATFDLYCNTEIIMLERLTPQALAGVLRELCPDNICTVPSMLTLLMKKVRASLAQSLPARTLTNALLTLCGFLRRCFGWKAGRVLLRYLNKKAFGGELRGFMIGASPCDRETMCFFLDMGIDIAQAYGLTELGAPLAVTGRGYYPGTTGRVPQHGEGMDIRIVNTDERGRGEVEVLSPFRMVSYLNEEDMADCFTPDGYFKTGDLGYFDKQRCLILCGRAKEAIVLRNGEKLLPEEIESRYQDIEDMAEIAAFRVPGEGGCDAFSLAAVGAKENGVPEEVVQLHILERAASLPAMYQPREVYMLRELPLSSTRKVQRFRLTEMVLQGLSAPLTEASLRPVGENGPASELRALLTQVAGPQWKSAELTEGLLLNLDSLQTIELFVAVQEHFGVDLFELAAPPETFGALLEAVTDFEETDKNAKPELDLARYPEPVSRAERVFYGSVEKFARLVWNVHSRGTENIPAEGNYLLCSNHMTVLDPAWISSSLTAKQRENTAIVGKSTLLESKQFKNFVRSRNLVPVDRTGNSLATLERCRELLDAGWNVEIFPEGTNYENAQSLMTFKEGAARLAIASGRPIVPIHIKGVAHVDPEHKTFLPPTGGHVEIIFGAPISPEGKDPCSLTRELRDAIAAL